MIGQILTSVTGLATSWLDSKAQQKLFETEIKKKQLTGEIDWELEAIRLAQNSWKDELWTIVFVCIVAANFVPYLQDAMARGFANLETLPPLGSVGYVCVDCRQLRYKNHEGFEKVNYRLSVVGFMLNFVLQFSRILSAQCFNCSLRFASDKTITAAAPPTAPAVTPAKKILAAANFIGNSICFSCWLQHVNCHHNRRQ